MTWKWVWKWPENGPRMATMNNPNRVVHGSHFSHHFWLIFDLIFIFYCQIIENGQKMRSKMATVNNSNEWPYYMSIFNNLAYIYEIHLVIDNNILKILSDFVRIWQHPFPKISQNLSGSGNDNLGECQGACLLLKYSWPYPVRNGPVGLWPRSPGVTMPVWPARFARASLWPTSLSI